MLSTLKHTLQVEFDGDGVCCILFGGMSERTCIFCEKFGCVEVIEGLRKYERTSIVANQAVVFMVCIMSYYRINANIY